MKILICLLTFYVSTLYASTDDFFTINDDQTHVYAKKSETYFTMEKLTEDNILFYTLLTQQEFPEDALERREAMTIEERAILGVLASLGKVVMTPISGTDVWFAYTQQEEGGPKEMCVSFLTQRGDNPLASTMGILRLPSFIRSKRPKTDRLSVRLLGFIAEVAHHLYPQKHYFITSPTDSMLNILNKALPVNNIWSKKIATMMLKNQSPEARSYISSAPFLISGKPTFTINSTVYDVPQYLRVHQDIFVPDFQVIILMQKLRELY